MGWGRGLHGEMADPAEPADPGQPVVVGSRAVSTRATWSPSLGTTPRVALGEDARAALERGAPRSSSASSTRAEPVYGVSTGFGALANTVIPAERSAELPAALVRSHAAGMGPEIERRSCGR